MCRTDASAREHGHRSFGDHRKVDVDAVALADAETLEHVGELRDLREQVAVRDGAGVARLSLPVERYSIAVSGLDVTVEAVVGDVQLAADEPFRVRELPVENGVPRLRPGQQIAGLACPETLVVLGRLVVEVRSRHQRVVLERLARREPPILRHQGVDGVVLIAGLGRHVGARSSGSNEKNCTRVCHDEATGSGQAFRSTTTVEVDGPGTGVVRSRDAHGDDLVVDHVHHLTRSALERRSHDSIPVDLAPRPRSRPRHAAPRHAAAAAVHRGAAVRGRELRRGRSTAIASGSRGATAAPTRCCPFRSWPDIDWPLPPTALSLSGRHTGTLRPSASRCRRSSTRP